jgi:hypothetical protein
MRRAVLAMAGVLTLALSSCDLNTGAPAARVGCNCPVAAAPAPVPLPDMRGSTAYAPAAVRHHVRHGRAYGYAWSGHSYYWRREYAEVSVQTYDYHSDSHAYYVGGSGGGSAGGGGYASHDGDDHHEGWQDGHGRWHATGSAAHGEIADAGARLKPWHGYDANCPDRH